MPTIKDIARLAGVSHGTVSNVMNKRGNVSIEKIKLVENAARMLGYTQNAQARQLRQGRNKFVGVIIPDFNHKTYVDLYTSLDHSLRQFGYTVNLYITNNIPHAEETIVEQVLSLNPDTVIIVSSLEKNNGLYDEKERLIFIDRLVENMPKNALYVSFDFKRAGSEMGERIVRDGHQNIALFCGVNQFSDEKQFQKGLSEALEARHCNLSLFSGDYSLAFSTAFDILSPQTRFDAIVTTNTERVDYLRSALSFTPGQTLPQIYCISSTEILPVNDRIKYELNYKLLGNRIAQSILQAENNQPISEQHFSLPNDGFQFQLPQVWTKKPATRLNFLTLASPTSEALKKIVSNCTAQTGIQVEITELDYDELYRTAGLMSMGSFYDLIRLDMLWISEMGQKLFRPLDLQSPELRPLLGQFSSTISTEYFNLNGAVYSLPFDPSVEMLYYRKDLFEDVKIKREYYEQHKRHLRAPQSFEEYNEVARFFTKKYNPNSPTDYGASLVFGTSSVAACDFLPRFKALGGEIFTPDGRVQMDTPLARQALKSYVESFEYTDHTTNMWWRKSLENFAAGKTAMVSSFSNHASHMVLSKGSSVVGKIGYATIPGGHPLLGGGVVGISKDSPKYEQCIEFLNWVYQDNISSIVTYLGGYSPCKKIYENEDLLSLYPWIKGVEDGFLIGSRRGIRPCELHSIRPGECASIRPASQFSDMNFEGILGMAVRNAVIGIVDIETALKTAQKLLDQEFNQ